MDSQFRSRTRRRRLAAVTALAAAAFAAGALLASAGEDEDAARAAVRDTGPGVATADAPAGDPTREMARGRAARPTDTAEPARKRSLEPIRWRDSEAVGDYAAGSLRRGVLLPAEGREWVSWDPILKRRPNREWRRWGTDRLVRATVKVLRDFGRDHPKAPRVAVGDLSRPEGGDFGPQFGAIGHASHQNGLDVDVYYPREDERVRPPKRPGQVDVALAQDLVDRFVEAGAEKVFVGPSLALNGPEGVVVPLVNHDNHLHARLPLG